MNDTHLLNIFLRESQSYNEICWHFPGILIKGSFRAVAAEFVHIIVQHSKHIYMFFFFQKSDGKCYTFALFYFVK